MARVRGRGSARDVDPLAPGRLVPCLALRVKTGTPTDSARTAPTDPTHGHGESTVGRGEFGFRVYPRTVRKYMPKRPPRRPRGDQRWSTFRNHARTIVACDFFVAVTATFLLFYVK